MEFLSLGLGKSFGDVSKNHWENILEQKSVAIFYAK